MPFRYRSLLFHERWSQAERWTYTIGILLLAVILRRDVFPADWPYVFLPYAVAVPAVYFFFGRWPGIFFLPASGIAALLTTPGHDQLTLTTATAYVLYLAQGGITCWLIDQLQRAMLAIRSEEHLKDEVLTAQTDWVTRIDAKGNFDYINAAAAAAFGLSAQESLGKPWHPVALGEDVSAIDTRLATLSPTNPVVISENRIHDATGQVIWGHFINRGIFDAKGSLIGILSVGRDITQHKQLEQQLADLARDREDLYQHAPCAYYSIDTDALFVKVNETLCKWLGVPAEQLLGKRRMTEFFTPAGGEQFRAHYPRFMQDGSLKGVEFEILHRDGTPRTVIVDANAVYDSQGRYLHSRSVMTDITARKQAEAEVQRLNDALERRVRERTAELLSTTEELESFTYSLSHDLRAPIRSINATASILLEEYQADLQDEPRKGLTRIQQTSQRMAQLMDAMLALNALGSPSAPLLPFHHATLVKDALDTLLPPDSPRRAQVVIHDLPAREGNPRRVQRVWECLLSNALKFTSPCAAPRIEVGYDADRHACFVRDNGVGFDMRYVEKIFQPFERVHDGTQFEGAGIGLAIADKIIRQNGGRIWCESSPGQGATFFFTP